MLNHNQNQFLIVSACLASLPKFLKGKSDVGVAHLHSAARALAFKSESVFSMNYQLLSIINYYQLSTNLDKYFFRCLLC